MLGEVLELANVFFDVVLIGLKSSVTLLFNIHKEDFLNIVFDNLRIFHDNFIINSGIMVIYYRVISSLVCRRYPPLSVWNVFIPQCILTFKLFNIESVSIPVVFHLCLFNNILYALQMVIRFLV